MYSRRAISNVRKKRCHRFLEVSEDEEDVMALANAIKRADVAAVSCPSLSSPYPNPSRNGSSGTTSIRNHSWKGEEDTRFGFLFNDNLNKDSIGFITTIIY